MAPTPDLVIAHAVFMAMAFGVFLPTGTFLAHTGFHKLHVYCQISGICCSLLGFILIIVQISQTSNAHFEIVQPGNNIHKILGLLIIVLATTAQPYFITHKMVWQHHKNGGLILILGFVNILLGLLLITSWEPTKSYKGFILAFYVLYVGSWALNFCFDPFRMRQGRLIELAQMKARGKDTDVNLSKLLQEAAVEQDDITVRKKWEVRVEPTSRPRIKYMSPGSRI